MPDTPSRLHERLGATEPLFRFAKVGTNTAGTYLIDQGSAGVSITRGGGDVAGLATNTMTFDLPLDQLTKVDPYLTVVAPRRGIHLTDHALERIDALAPDPNGNAEDLRARFSGQPSVVDLTDYGDRNLRRDWRLSATFTDVTSARLITREKGGESIHSAGGSHGSRLDDLFTSTFERVGLAATLQPLETPPLQVLGAEWHYVRHDPTDPTEKIIPIGEVLSLLATCGHLVRNTRAGTPQLLSHNELVSRAEALFGLTPGVGLTRAQVLAPTRWSKGPGRFLRLKVIIARGDGSTETYTVDPAGYSPGSVTKDEDLSSLVGTIHSGESVAGPRRAIQARVDRESVTLWRPDRLVVDVVRLLTDDRPAHQLMARRLLALEVGDPLLLGLDWPLPDVYQVTQITERITANDWRLELDALPFTHLSGLPSPDVPAGTTWATRHPLETTWTTAPDTSWENA